MTGSGIKPGIRYMCFTPYILIGCGCLFLPSWIKHPSISLPLIHHWAVVAAKLNHLALKSFCTLISSTSSQRQLRQYNLSALPVLQRRQPNRKLLLRRLGGSSLSSLLLSPTPSRAFHLITSNNCSILSNTSNKILDLLPWCSGPIAAQRKQFLSPAERNLHFSRRGHQIGHLLLP